AHVLAAADGIADVHPRGHPAEFLGEDEPGREGGIVEAEEVIGVSSRKGEHADDGEVRQSGIQKVPLTPEKEIAGARGAVVEPITDTRLHVGTALGSDFVWAREDDAAVHGGIQYPLR